MTNWVLTELAAEGDPAAIARLRGDVAGDDLALDFRRAWAAPVETEGRAWDPSMAREAAAGRVAPEDCDAWTWRMARWGTTGQNLWCDEAAATGGGRVAYLTESAGAPPTGLVEHLAAAWPSLRFRLAWFGPDAFAAGVVRLRDGRVVRRSEAEDEDGIRRLIAGTGVADAFEREVAFLAGLGDEEEDDEDENDEDEDEGAGVAAPSATAPDEGGVA